jgi:hypothetical protein
VPLRIIADLSERPEDANQSTSAKGRDVFDEREFRSDVGHEAMVLPPESRLRAVDSFAFASDGKVGARESSGEHVGEDAVVSEKLSGERSDVIVDPHTGPMLVEDFSAERIFFAKTDDGEPRAFQSERDTADARENVENFHFVRRCRRLPTSVPRLTFIV